MCKPHSKVTHIKQQKYFHHLKGRGYKNSVLYPRRLRWWKYVCCFICVILLWALHSIIKRQFFYINNGSLFMKLELIHKVVIGWWISQYWHFSGLVSLSTADVSWYQVRYLANATFACVVYYFQAGESSSSTSAARGSQPDVILRILPAGHGRPSSFSSTGIEHRQ